MSNQTSLEELGRRAVTCKHWRWMPGMLLLPHVDGCECCEDRNFPRRAARLPAVFTTDIDVPDLSDPATLGCLLHLVRQAWGSDEWSRNVVPVFNGIDAWTVGCLDMQGSKAPRLLFLVNKINCMPVGIGSSEAEALVIALEAAP